MLDYMHHLPRIQQLRVIKSSVGNLGSTINNMSCLLMDLWDVIKSEIG